MQDTRQQLDLDIRAYLKAKGKNRDGSQLSESVVKKAIGKIHESVWDGMAIGPEELRDKRVKTFVKYLSPKPEEKIYLRIVENFEPLHYRSIEAFIKRLEAIHEQEDKEADLLSDAYYAALEAYGEFDEYSEQSDWIVEIHKDSIQVVANVKGVGDRIPKENRKYIGDSRDVRWSYPLSMREQLCRTSMPVLDLEKIKAEAKKDEPS